MLYEIFNSFKKDFFTSRIDNEIIQNLNPKFELREYQKEALGRFAIYLSDGCPIKKQQPPIHLLFNMATGSGKTILMAYQILYLYKLGYRDFIFFTRLGNIIEKTRDNFLNSLSEKYLFAEKIVINGREIKIKEVENFDGVNDDDINILFATTSLLHNRLNQVKENSFSFEDFKEGKLVLIADEAHNLSSETLRKKLTKTEIEDKKCWENTVIQLLNTNKNENILLEFTATARLEEDYPGILEKYKDKAIFRYDFKQFRQDGYSKDVKTIQVGASLKERVLTAIVISQYRRKIAEKYKIILKPIVLFKANRVSEGGYNLNINNLTPQIIVSNQFKEAFHKLINNLKIEDLKNLQKIENETLKKAFDFFQKNNIELENLVAELKNDFSKEKCLSVDEEKEVEKKQILLNSLEDKNNATRAIFATEKLNEGWDVLNLFDIVRLYNSRDAKSNRPGKTTVAEAQLIGRGARYYPFKIKPEDDLFKRKFDLDSENELRILETLYYHSTTNPRYIQELESVLRKEGVVPSNIIRREINIKDDFKKKNYFWDKGLIFLNKRKERVGDNIFSFAEAKIEFDYKNKENIFKLPTKSSEERLVFDDKKNNNNQNVKEITKVFQLKKFRKNAVRAALDKFPKGTFESLKKKFGKLKSITEFIESDNYLGGIFVNVIGLGDVLRPKDQSKNFFLSSLDEFEIAKFVIEKILLQFEQEDKKYYGTSEFYGNKIKEIIKERAVLYLDAEEPRAQNMREFDFSSKDWFAQNEIWGTDEEEAFLRFMDEFIQNKKVKNKYDEIALFRNEEFFKIFDFDAGEGFSPDFVTFLKERKTQKQFFYQIFIEAKGGGFFDENNRFEKSQEGWKQKFLLSLGKKAKIIFESENSKFIIYGLPFFNKGDKNPELKKEFEEALENKLLV
ncbi:MAG: DEAD/DEAH box helicase family protein [Candidatus Pacebacteria bacterium]|nr:DEAD/DEAH box helicase family protein [Candidatus Paceibacterota bacterium]